MSVRHDARGALRLIWGSPVAFGSIIAALALAIGGSVAVFALVFPLLFPALPYGAPDRVLDVRRTLGSSATPLLLSPEFAGLRARSRACSPLVAWRLRTVLFELGDGAERLDAAEVSAGFFDALGLAPLAGRSFTTADEAAQAPVALVSEQFWKTRLGGDGAVIGRSVRLDAAPSTIVGVVPDASPIAPRSTHVWTPLHMTAAGLLVARLPGVQSHRAAPLPAMCRLAPGATLEQARTELEALDRAAGFGRGDRLTFHLTPLTDVLFGEPRALLLLVQGAILILLALVATNAVGLLLVRTRARERELRVRIFLGASAAGLARGRAVEALAVAIPGGLIGWVVAGWIVRAVVSHAPRVPGIGASLDATSMMFAGGGVLAVTVVVAGVPAVHAWWAHAGRHSGGIASAGHRGFGTLRTLLAVEVALAIVLVVASATLVATFARVRRIPLGFEPSGVSAARVTIPDRHLPDLAARSAFAEKFAEAIRGMGAASAVAFATDIPFSGDPPRGEEVVLERNAGPETVTAASIVVSTGYFRALGIPILQGRGFTTGAAPGDLPSLVVSASFARQYLGAVPLETVVRIGGVKWRVAGIAGDFAASAAPGLPRDPAIYRRLEDLRVYNSHTPAWRWITRMYFLARSDLRAEALAPVLAATLRGVDRGLALDHVVSMSARVRDASARVRYTTLLVAALGILSLAIAAVGVHAVLLHFVVERRKEIGIRLTIGATPRHLAALVARQAGTGVALGLLAGSAAGWSVPRLLGSVLPEVHVAPPGMVVSAVAIISAVAMLGASAPLARACRVDPARTLRAE